MWIRLEAALRQSCFFFLYLFMNASRMIDRTVSSGPIEVSDVQMLVMMLVLMPRCGDVERWCWLRTSLRIMGPTSFLGQDDLGNAHCLRHSVVVWHIVHLVAVNFSVQPFSFLLILSSSLNSSHRSLSQHSSLPPSTNCLVPASPARNRRCKHCRKASSGPQRRAFLDLRVP
jgi:hypothetical protein